GSSRASCASTTSSRWSSPTWSPSGRWCVWPRTGRRAPSSRCRPPPGPASSPDVSSRRPSGTPSSAPPRRPPHPRTRSASCARGSPPSPGSWRPPAAGPASASRRSTPVPDPMTFLFVPGDRQDRFDKAVATGADLVVLDLEDAVGPGDKDVARGHVVDWLTKGGHAAVRINAGGEVAERDVAALARLPVPVMVPKAEDPTELGSLR